MVRVLLRVIFSSSPVCFLRNFIISSLFFSRSSSLVFSLFLLFSRNSLFFLFSFPFFFSSPSLSLHAANDIYREIGMPFVCVRYCPLHIAEGCGVCCGCFCIFAENREVQCRARSRCGGVGTVQGHAQFV